MSNTNTYNKQTPRLLTLNHQQSGAVVACWTHYSEDQASKPLTLYFQGGWSSLLLNEVFQGSLLNFQTIWLVKKYCSVVSSYILNSNRSFLPTNWDQERRVIINTCKRTQHLTRFLIRLCFSAVMTVVDLLTALPVLRKVKNNKRGQDQLCNFMLYI